MNSNKTKLNTSNVWQTYAIGDFSEISRGGSPRPIQDYLTDSKDGYNWLRIGDVPTNGKYINRITAKIIKEGLKKTTQVKAGDFILSNSMSFGRPYIMNVDACIHDGWLALKNLDADVIERDFLFYLLLSPKLQNDFRNYSAGSGVLNLKKETVEKVLVTIPEVPEQKRIVKVLETWDVAIEKLEQMIELKREVKKGLMQKLLTGELRLPGFNGDFVKSCLADVANIIMGQSPTSDTYNEKAIGLPLIQGNNDIKHRKTIKRVWTSKPTKIADSGSIVMTVRAPVGLIGRASEKVCLGRGVCAMNAVSINENYLYHYLISFENQWAKYEQGSTFTAVNGKDIRDLEIIYPSSVGEQSAIALVLESSDRELQLLTRKLTVLKEQKKYFLNNLVTGQIRTPENL